MCKVNVLEAKTNFSKLLALLESGDEEEVIVCRHDKPVAKMTLVPKVDVSKRIGIAKGKFSVPDDFDDDALNTEIAEMFYGDKKTDDELFYSKGAR